AVRAAWPRLEDGRGVQVAHAQAPQVRQQHLGVTKRERRVELQPVRGTWNARGQANLRGAETATAGIRRFRRLCRFKTAGPTRRINPTRIRYPTRFNLVPRCR